MTASPIPTKRREVSFQIPNLRHGMEFEEAVGFGSPSREYTLATPPSSPSNRIINAAALERIIRESARLLISSEYETEDGDLSTAPVRQCETCHHRFSPNLQEQRNPWNSPDALDRDKPSRMQLVPPPPPPPPRRIRIASIENFHPTPIIGGHFPQSPPPPQDYSSSGKANKRSYSMDLDCKENEIDSSYNVIPSSSVVGGPLRKKPKLAMKKQGKKHLQHLFDDMKPLSLKGILARMAT